MATELETELLEALSDRVLAGVMEDAHESDDYLVFYCNECNASAKDDHLAIEHDTDCGLGAAAALVIKARLVS